jgi:hypothetical protein
MKVAIVVFVIGEEYINRFSRVFKNNLINYCNKYNYTLIILDELIRHEEDMDRKKFYWQRLLIPNKFKEYDYVVSMDSDIYINPDSPPLPLNEIPEGKIGAVNERKYFNNYEWREKIQTKMGWDKTGKDWHLLSGETRDYNDHINGGFIIYQPKYHGEKLVKLYDDNINNYMKYHQDDQSILSLYFIDNDLIYWLDERFNKIWFFWKEIFYPGFNDLPNNIKKKYIQNFLNLNYFTHFTGGGDYEFNILLE